MANTNLVMVISGSFKGVEWKKLMKIAECTQTAYDIVADYVAKGLILQEVKVYSLGYWADWPIDMFTNETLEHQIQPIQQEWETILYP